MTHLPADVGPITAAYLCEVVARRVPGDGTWSYQVVHEVTGDLVGLQTALAVPDYPRYDGACFAILDLGRPIWVVGQRSALVRVPVGACHRALPDAKAFVEALPTKVISERRLGQVESQTALDSGCWQDVKDLIRVGASDQVHPRAAHPPQLDETKRWTVCRYDAIQRDQDLLGSLTSAAPLSPKEVAALNAALATARVDPSCRRDDHTRFATVIDRDGLNDWLDVALDGCAVQRGSDWWRADTEVRRFLSRHSLSD